MLSDAHTKKVGQLQNRSEVPQIRNQHKMPCALNFYSLLSITFIVYFLKGSNSFIHLLPIEGAGI